MRYFFSDCNDVLICAKLEDCYDISTECFKSSGKDFIGLVKFCI